MRLGAYHLFEIVAWPAAVWCTVEVALRGATQSYSGIASSALLGAMAACTIAACRWRCRQLAVSAAASTLR